MRLLVCLMAVTLLSNVCWAQVALQGKELALKSSGSADGNGWKLTENGFVGTYLKLDKAGEVHITVNATASGKARVNVVVADSKQGDDLSAGAGTVQKKISLPAGMYLLRVECPNLAANQSIKFDKITVNGATVQNENNDANALAAADDYIANFRRGAVVVKLPAAPVGAAVSVQLKRHEFNFGAAVGGFDKNELFVANPAPDSDAAKYQAVLRKHFNMVVPGNAGKWAYNEDKKDVVTMDYIDAIRTYAAANNLRMRMHTVLWNTGQQPKWVIDLVNAALKGDEAAKTELRKHISERIGYFVKDRAKSYEGIDVLNEPYHQPAYWDIFGVQGVADIHKEAGEALKSAGASTRLYVNEYNVLDWSQAWPFKGPYQKDPNANWYRHYVETLLAHGATVDGVGVQYYADLKPDRPDSHSPARIASVLQNLSVTGLPITLTEFGVQTAGDHSRAPKVQSDIMRLVFGCSASNGFVQWGFWQKEMWDQATGAAFFDNDWKPTAVYESFEKQMAKWVTDEKTTLRGDGTIAFTGFYGDYVLTVGERTYPLTITKGKSNYTVADK